MLLQAGNAGSNTASDRKTVLAAALAQLPGQPGYRVGRKVLVRYDSGGGTHGFVRYCHQRHLHYSVGFSLSEATAAAEPQRHSPFTHRLWLNSQLGGDFLVVQAFGAGQYDLRSQRQRLRRLRATTPSKQRVMLHIGQDKLRLGAATSTAPNIRSRKPISPPTFGSTPHGSSPL
jgi:hypothetical protein